MTDHTFEEPELTDEQLDALLHAAGEDLLAHVRATGDPTSALLALMEQGAATLMPAKQAVVITARAQTQAYLHTLRQSAPLIESYKRLAELPCEVEVTERLREETASLIEVLTDLDLDVAHDRAHDRSLALYNDLTRNLHRISDRPRDRDPDRDSYRDLVLNLDLALDRARARARDLVRAFDRHLYPNLHTLGRARDFARALDRALGRALDCARDLDLARGRDLDLARASALDCARDLRAATRLLPDAAVLRTCGVYPALSPALGPDWDPLIDDLRAEERFVQNLHSTLMTIRVDASYADLTGLNLGSEDREALHGVVWTPHTRWPDALLAFVEHNSRQIGNGIYQVSPGAARDSSGIAALK